MNDDLRDSPLLPLTIEYESSNLTPSLGCLAMRTVDAARVIEGLMFKVLVHQLLHARQRVGLDPKLRLTDS